MTDRLCLTSLPGSGNSRPELGASVRSLLTFLSSGHQLHSIGTFLVHVGIISCYPYAANNLPKVTWPFGDEAKF